MNRKLKTIAEAKLVVEEQKKNGKRIVFTNGCFDILHPGHVRYLEEARKLGDFLIVGLNSDESVRKIKGAKRPLIGELARAEVLAGLASVDMIVIFDKETPLELIMSLRPDVLVKGGDWQVDQIVGGREVKSWGGEVVSIRYQEGYSTTGIIERIISVYCNPELERR